MTMATARNSTSSDGRTAPESAIHIIYVERWLLPLRARVQLEYG